MKYYLIIGYQLVDKYKNFPTVRVHINGRLVDEFECDNEKSTEISSHYRNTWSSLEKCGTVKKDQLGITTYTTPAKFRNIELDASTWLDHGELVLTVSNNNSNYNNGFMTKKSQVWFTPVLLIKKNVYDSESTMHRIFKKINDARRTGRWGMAKAHKWDSKIRHKWPGFNTYHDRRNSNPETINLFRGGEHEIKFDIIRKHKTHMLVEEDVPHKGFFYIDRFFEAWYQHHKKKYFEIGCEYKIDRNIAFEEYKTLLKEKK